MMTEDNIADIKAALARLHAAMDSHNAIMFGEGYTPDATKTIPEQLDELAEELKGFA